MTAAAPRARPRTPARPALFLVALALGVLVTPGPAEADDAAQRQLLEQRIRLVAQLMADSPATQRIVASGNEQVLARLNEGRVHHSLAAERLARGDLAGAGQAVDEALRHIGAARRMVPDAPARTAALRQRYEQVSSSTERLLQAYRDRARRAPDHDNADLVAADMQLADARRLAAQSQYDNANRALARAEHHLLAGMTRLLNATTLDYSPSFSSQAEEFDYESNRYAALGDLVPLAVADLKPSPEAAALVERYVAAGRTLQAQAVRHAQAREYADALASIRNATAYVQRALLAAGLVTPAPTENPR